MVDAWFDYWIDIKKKTVRPNTVRNYTERYNHNIKKIIGKMLLSEGIQDNSADRRGYRHIETRPDVSKAV